MTDFYRAAGKRGLDLMLAAATLVVLLPVFAIIAILIKSDDGGAVIFRQRRMGRGGVPFVLLKFRSMRENVGDRPSAQASALPITRVGAFLRRTNLDELPQLVNVLRGEMSIVGPRPALPAQADLVRMRASNGSDALRPGLTGLAQVSSYDGMPVEEKARLDATYSSRVSLRGDLAIILRTLDYLRRPPPVY